MTKVTILGQGEVAQHEPKKIEFVKYISTDGEVGEPRNTPSDFKHIELICKKYRGLQLDVMFCFDNSRNGGLLYLGHFNDGVV